MTLQLENRDRFNRRRVNPSQRQEEGKGAIIFLNNRGGGQRLERWNVERPIFRNFKTKNMKITKDEFFDSFIFEFIFSLLINYSHNLIIFQIVKY